MRSSTELRQVRTAIIDLPRTLGLRRRLVGQLRTDVAHGRELTSRPNLTIWRAGLRFIDTGPSLLYQSLEA